MGGCGGGIEQKVVVVVIMGGDERLNVGDAKEGDEVDNGGDETDDGRELREGEDIEHSGADLLMPSAHEKVDGDHEEGREE